MNRVSSKELFEFHTATSKHYRKAIRTVQENFELSKTLTKYNETIQTNLDTYEIMYDTLIKVREVSSKIMRSNELETIEGEMKVLNDTFWD